MNSFIAQVEKSIAIYNDINLYASEMEGPIVHLNGTTFFDKVIEFFGPCLRIQDVEVDLCKVFDVVFHTKSKSLLIGTTGVTITSIAPFSSVPYITKHIACSVYHPKIGLESVNIGLIGNVYKGNVIIRAESACPPAFIFGSQRCNCSYQWSSIRELAAHFNPVDLPKDLLGEEFEKWVEGQFSYESRKHIPKQDGQGLVLMYLDSQAGMGSGYTEEQFSLDLYNKALMRQLAENSVEQLYHTTIKRGYECLGVYPDARRQAGEAGYQIPAIVLEWLGVCRDIIVLSNNTFKIKQLQEHGFNVKRVKSLGRIPPAGQREAKQRGVDFDHLDMDGKELTFDEEIARLKNELLFI